MTMIPSIHFPVSTLSPSTGVERCHNLRPSLSGRGLTGVGSPAPFAPALEGEGRFIDGGAFHHADGEVSVFLARGCELLVTKGGDVASLGLLPAEPVCAVELSDGLLLMTAAGPRRLRWASGVWGEEPLEAELPPLMFERLDAGTVSAAVGDVWLKGSYDSRSATLTRADASTVGTMLAGAYRWLGDRALASRRFIQPVMARYRLLGHDGSVVYTSAPVLVAPEGGVQLAECRLTLSGDSFTYVEPATLTARTFTLGLRMAKAPSELWHALVGRVEVLVSPQFHPLGHGDACACSLSGFTTAPSASLRARLPGVSESIRPGAAGGRLRAQVDGVLSRLGTAMRCVASVAPPAGDIRLIADSPFDTSLVSTAVEMARLDAILALSVPSPTPESVMLRRMDAPHTVTAARAVRDGDLIAWGALSATSSPGYSPAELTSSVRPATSGTPAAVAVTLGRGEGTAVSMTTFHSLCPAALSPLLVYPDGEATALTFIAPGVRREFQLTPSSCGGWSFCLDPDGAEMELPEGSGEGFAVPAPHPMVRGWPDAVAVSRVDSPLRFTAVTLAGTGGVGALAPGRRPGAGLEFGRTRFHAFGPGGTAVVTVNAARTRLASSLIDRRGVEGPECVAVTPSGVAAIASGVPVMVDGNKVRTLLPGLMASSLGWNAPRGELWLFHGPEAAEATVLCPDSGVTFTRSSLMPVSTLTLPSGLRLLAAGGALLDASAETSAPVRVVHRSRIPVAVAPASLRRLRVCMFGAVVDGGVTLRADCGAGSPTARTLMHLGISGVLSHPLVEAFPMVHAHWLTLEISAIVSSPSTLSLHESD